MTTAPRDNDPTLHMLRGAELRAALKRANERRGAKEGDDKFLWIGSVPGDISKGFVHVGRYCDLRRNSRMFLWGTEHELIIAAIDAM